MKQPDTQNWPESLEPLTGLLLFAQIWDEMLFDYTLDSYKPKRFNVLGLCQELIDSFDALENHSVRPRSITPIKDELLHGLGKDRISKAALGARFDLLQAELRQWNPEKPNKRVAYAASTIKQVVEPVLQKKLAEELQTTIADPRCKGDIADLSGWLLTEVLRKGYSPNYIYHLVQSFFFRERTITDVNALSLFLRWLLSAETTYEVVFKMSLEGELLARNAEEDFLQSSRQRQTRCSAPNEREQQFLQSSGPDVVFISAPGIKAKDRYSARREAEQRLTIASLLTGFLNHKIRLDLGGDALVYMDEPTTRAYIVGSPTRPTMKRSDAPDMIIDEALRRLVGPIISETTDPDTSERLGGALRAHSVAVGASITENQFANLWTALETITVTSTQDTAITSIIRHAVPVLSLKYFLKLVSELRSDIRKCIPQAWAQACSSRQQDESEIKFLVRLLSTDDARPLRDQLYAACDRNPLLRYRISRFHDSILASVDSARELLNEHEKRITWHLHRLYRARNALLHQGTSNESLDLLVENLHDYFDHIMGEVVERLESEAYHGTIDKVLFDCEIEYQAYRNALANPPASLSRHQTSRLIVFGSPA
jgi:hypothetical protein